MIATFIIEISLAVHTLWRYKLSSVTKISSTLLVCLATFQLAEYNVCEGSFGLDSTGWAKLGYVAITLLPPLGIHLINRLSNDKRQWPVVAGYSLGASFVGLFLFATNGISAGTCLGNYVIFEQAPGSGLWYGAYYYGLLVVALAYGSMRTKAVKQTNIKKSLYSLMIGYLAFMVPTTFVNIIDPSTIAGIPSIMCGFAVIMALFISGKVLPLYSDDSQRNLSFKRLISTAGKKLGNFSNKNP